MELSALLEKLSEKYPEEPMLEEAIALADSADPMNAGQDIGIDDEMEPAPDEGDYDEEGGEDADLDSLLAEDLDMESSDSMGDDDMGDDEVDVTEPVPMLNKKKKKKPSEFLA